MSEIYNFKEMTITQAINSRELMKITSSSC